MLNDMNLGNDQRDKKESKSLLKGLRKKLAGLQQQIKEAKLPIIVLI